MRFRNTLVAILVLAGLGAFIYYYEYRGEEARESAREAEKNVFTFEREKVEEIVVTRKGSPELTLRREGGRWRIAAPLQTLADDDKVSALLSSLSYMRIEEKLEGVAETDLDQFKLKDPEARVSVKLTEAGENLVLSLGDKAPIGSSYYAQKSGAAEVLLVSGDAAQILSADAASLRYKKVIGTGAWKVARFKIEKGAQAVAFARGRATDEWLIESPVSFPADGSKVQGLWFDLESLEADAFESENPSTEDLRRFGLDTPALSLTVWTKSENGEAGAGQPPPSVRVSFAAPAGADWIFVRRDDMPSVMKVKKEILEKLEKPLTSLSEYRETRAAPLDRWKLSRLEIRRKEGPVTLVKDQESSRWRWGGETGAELDSGQINALLDAIEGIKATGFVDGTAPPAADQEDAEVAFTVTEGTGDASRTVTVTVPRRAQGGSGGEAMRRVFSSSASSVYLVSPAAVQTLIEKSSALAPPAAPTAADPNVPLAVPPADTSPQED